MAAAHIRTRRRAARAVGTALSAGLLMAAVTAALTGAARQPAQPAQPAPLSPSFPVQAAFSAPGPYATTTGTATDGTAAYDLYYAPGADGQPRLARQRREITK